MAHFKDRFQFSQHEDTVLFSVIITQFYVVEHSIPSDAFKAFQEDWDDNKYDHRYLKVQKKSDGYYQVIVANPYQKSVYRLSATDFSKWLALLRRTVNLIDQDQGE